LSRRTVAARPAEHRLPRRAIPLTAPQNDDIARRFPLVGFGAQANRGYADSDRPDRLA
jgi:hypothetical protein